MTESLDATAAYFARNEIKPNVSDRSVLIAPEQACGVPLEFVER